MARSRFLTGLIAAAILWLAAGLAASPARAHGGHAPPVAGPSRLSATPAPAHPAPDATLATLATAPEPGCHDACCAHGAACCATAILPGLAPAPPPRGASEALRPRAASLDPGLPREARPPPPRSPA